MIAHDEAQERFQALRYRLRADQDVLRAVLDHHAPVPTFYQIAFPGSGVGAAAMCRGCDPGEYAESNADWPCSTFELIEREIK